MRVLSMRHGWPGVLAAAVAMLASATAGEKYGPEAALEFARSYRGEIYRPDERSCYPGAMGVPFGDCENILPMTGDLWRPRDLAADFRQRMAALPADERKQGIIVLLKTERCAPREMRACTTTTAALEKRATPLAGNFLIYGVLLKPRDRDDPPGTLAIETGVDGWKNEAAGTYFFTQGPGATLVFLDPATGAIITRTNALRLGLTESAALAEGGRAERLHAQLQEVLATLAQRREISASKS